MNILSYRLNNWIDNNEVYWMGLKLSYEPALLKIPSDEVIKKVGAVHGSVCAVTRNF